ncbi:DUF2225 domain-containing protein [Pontibacillus sp. ALD_SL1]|uniref:DUF2225 domain-containing protein n=1 Tax=Pontibacillus sp. ALD_SL1 TaxID=2777185 RepID=UPI001A960E8D|nr:DUF2225 domain-containing protein [Pontibacillus sp. ALD_SL1]QSS99416.1 DUF2225 domain-containing protein [Pontibacillus sp. ALD_SL1]
MSESIHPLYDKQSQCPFCAHTFTTKKVRSRFTRPIKTDTDFCTLYKHEQYSPLLYVPIVCPDCGYSYTDQFSTLLSEQSRNEITEKLVKRWTPQNYSEERTENNALNAYKLAIYTAQLKKEKAIVIAGLYLRVVWLYRKRKDALQEARFIRLAEEMYKKAYEEDDFFFTEMNALRVLYLIGELNRRLGRNEEAIKYFSLVVEKKQLAFDPKIINMARDGWFQLKDDQKKTANKLLNTGN